MSNHETSKPGGLVVRRLLGGFQNFARTVVRSSGHPMAFVVAMGTIVLWGLTGPWFHFGNTWLLVINTVTNILSAGGTSGRDLRWPARHARSSGNE
jgi:hypothetical protein